MAQTLLITGFHRSGTSMTASLLQNAGLSLGEVLLPAGDSNPYGHYEDTEIVRFHDQLLQARGLNWQVANPFLAHVSASQWQWMSEYAVRRATHELWGFKDPRLCLFLSLWKQVLPQAKIIYVYRPAAECLHSLKRRSARELINARGGTDVHLRFWQDLNLAAATYLCYTRMFLSAARHHPQDVVFVSRRAIIDGYDLGGALRTLWGLPLEATSIDRVFDPSVTDTASGQTFVSDPKLLESIRQVTAQIESQLLENIA